MTNESTSSPNAHVREIIAGERFAFGANWTRTGRCTRSGASPTRRIFAGAMSIVITVILPSAPGITGGWPARSNPAFREVEMRVSIIFPAEGLMLCRGTESQC